MRRCTGPSGRAATACSAPTPPPQRCRRVELRGRRPGSAPEATVALLKRTHRAQEVDLAEGRPVDVREVVLAVGALPEQESGQPFLAARPDDEVRIGQIGGVQVPLYLVLGDRFHDLFD